MDSILSGLFQAVSLILRLDRTLVSIIVLSLEVSALALVVAVLLGLPAGVLLALKRFPGRDLVVGVMNTFMGLPPVVVGLFLYLLLSRRGPLGFLGLLYSPSAMVIAQAILAFPIVAALAHSSIVHVDPLIRRTARTLGATPMQEALAVVNDARYGIVAAIIAAFGRVMAEVGAILIVGGNIAGYTRVMTTTIALETDKGNFELALALGLVLIAISFAVNGLLQVAQRKGVAGAGA